LDIDIGGREAVLLLVSQVHDFFFEGEMQEMQGESTVDLFVFFLIRIYKFQLN
jgi:hypothetical protein